MLGVASGNCVTFLRSTRAGLRGHAVVALWACENRSVGSDWDGTDGYLGNVGSIMLLGGKR